MIKGGVMPKEEGGVKRVCPTTGKRFYDLGRDPIISPYTGEVVTIDTGKGSRSLVSDKAVKTKDKDTTADDDLVLDDDLDNDDDLDDASVSLDDDVLDDDDDTVSLDDLADVASDDDDSN
jgi:uncharacterized protein (TIGR02300 family)